MSRIDLSAGGASWRGWTLSRYGRAREHRLIAPTGENFTAEEIAELPALRLDVNFLTVEVKRLRALTSIRAVYLSDTERATLAAAGAILAAALAARRGA